jgi:hypothetical protein
MPFILSHDFFYFMRWVGGVDNWCTFWTLIFEERGHTRFSFISLVMASSSNKENGPKERLGTLVMTAFALSFY